MLTPAFTITETEYCSDANHFGDEVVPIADLLLRVFTSVITLNQGIPCS